MKTNGTSQETRKPSALALACASLVALGTASLAAGCSDNASGVRAEFGRPRAMAPNGQTVFVGAATDPRMKVYSLDTHKVIRAPNPIFSLSVPTIALPHAVASFRSPDGLISSPFVLSLSSSRALLSVTSAAQRTLNGYAHVPGVPLSLAVMAMKSSDDDTVAVIGTMDRGNATLYRVNLPANLADKAIDPSMVSFVKMPLLDLTGVIPQNLVASPTNPSLLAVADRAGAQDGILLVNIDEGSVTKVSTGAPISSLAFDAKGERLFALIDSDACMLTKSTTEKSAKNDVEIDSDDPSSTETNSAPTKGYSNNIDYDDRINPGTEGARSGLKLGECTGLLAVDVATAKLVKPAPLKIPGILTAVAAGGAAELELPDDSKLAIDPFVLVASSEGTLYPIDGAKVAMIEAANSKYAVAMTHVDANGRTSFCETEPTEIAVNQSRSVNETITILYEGRLPDLQNRTGLVTSKGLISTGTDFSALGVAVGDRMEIRGAKDPCKSFVISDVEKGHLSFDGDIPETCQGQKFYDVRAARQYLVSGSITGFMGRVSDGEAFFHEGPEPYDFGSDDADTSPAFSFVMTGEDHTVDSGWKVTIKHCTEPYNIPVSSITLPTDIVCDFVSGDFYVAYQGGNSILRVVPNKLEHDSVSTTDGLSVFR